MPLVRAVVAGLVAMGFRKVVVVVACQDPHGLVGLAWTALPAAASVAVVRASGDGDELHRELVAAPGWRGRL